MASKKQPSIDNNNKNDTESEKPRACRTYYIRLPRNQTYRVPSPENALRYQYFSTRRHKQANCRRYFCYSIAAILLLTILAALISGVFFLVYQSHKPRFSLTGISVAGVNLTSSSTISPVIKIKLEFKNVSDKLGLIYTKGIIVGIFYDGIDIGRGEFTAFNQPAKNVTVMETELRGSTILLTSSSRKGLMGLEKKREVPLSISIVAPLKFKAGAVTTWTITVKVYCQITVDKLTESATVMTENCNTN